MKGLKYGIYTLILLVGLTACSSRRRIVRDTRETDHIVTADTARTEASISIDTIRTEREVEVRDSSRVEEDARIEIQYDTVGRPAVITVHRVTTGQNERKEVVEELSRHVISDSARAEVHVGGSTRDVETVSHESKTVKLGPRPSWTILLIGVVLLALVILFQKRDICQKRQ